MSATVIPVLFLALAFQVSAFKVHTLDLLAEARSLRKSPLDLRDSKDELSSQALERVEHHLT